MFTKLKVCNMDRHCYPSALQIVIQSLILISSIIVFHIQ